MPWESNAAFETANINTVISDPSAFCVDSRTGTVVIVCDQKVILVDGEGNAVSKDISGVDDFSGYKDYDECASLTNAGYLLVLCTEKVVVVDLATGSAREAAGKGYRLCSCSREGRIFLADDKGCIYNPAACLKEIYDSPGLLDDVGPAMDPVQGERMPWSRFDNAIPREDAKEMAMRVNPSASVINALAVSDVGAVWYCAGHSLTCITAGAKENSKSVEKFPNERSADGLSYPTALFLVGETLFAQCMDGIRKVPATLETGGEASLAIKAMDMLDEEDEGSPEPKPSDFIGVDDKYLYVLIERNFYQGKALRRFCHGLKPTSSQESSLTKLDGSGEMQVSTKNSSEEAKPS